MKFLFLAIFLVLFLFAAAMLFQKVFASFSAQDPKAYADTTPVIDIRQHLGGDMVSEGVIFGPDGQVAVRFVADMKGEWSGDKGVLSEDFRYAGGTSQARRWEIVLGQDGAFTATAPDIVGTAQGQHSGSTIRMTYRLRLAEGAGGHVLDVVDWIYLMEDGTMMNKSEMRKFGIKVAELIATIRPVGN